MPKLADPTSWVLTAMIAAIVLIGCRTVLTWGWSVVLLGLALAGPLPVAFTGHSSAGGAHDIATDSLMVHVLAAALWVGGLAALLGAVASRSSDRASALATAVPRFSALALVCWLAMAVTGVVNALVRVPLSALRRHHLRRARAREGCWRCSPSACSAPSTADDRSARPRRATRGRCMRLGAAEVLLMLATIGLAVALGRSAPPDTGVVPSRVEVLIGYDLVGPPTLARLLFDWRLDLIFGSAAIAAGRGLPDRRATPPGAR